MRRYRLWTRVERWLQVGHEEEGLRALSSISIAPAFDRRQTSSTSAGSGISVVTMHLVYTLNIPSPK